MDLNEFHYELPPELIATHPAARRDESRLMVARGDGSPFEHRVFSDLPGLLRPGDCLVLNDSKVLPARLRARRVSGGQLELLLLSPVAGLDLVWDVMVRPARKFTPGLRVELPGGAAAVVIEGGGERTRRLRLKLPAGVDIYTYLEQHGEMPLPPYILHQRKEQGEAPAAGAEDRERYQTVYAAPPGSIAAPTAGLHFTPELLERLRQDGVEIRRVTLHVGIGTFEPIEECDVTQHRMHFERYEIGAEDACAIEAALLDPARRVVAVGTTSVRTLESCFARHGRIQAGAEETDMFIYPGYKFGVVRAMVTNFHLPGSTLMLLVSALAGRERILSAYREAIEKKYRFYSYGDAMLIEAGTASLVETP